MPGTCGLSAHEEYRECGKSCEPTCEDPTPSCLLEMSVLVCTAPEFVCEAGYVRCTTSNACLKVEDCPVEPTGSVPPSPPAGTCPRDCTKWYDGCNTCRCVDGRTTECTEMDCVLMQEPMCTEHKPTGPSNGCILDTDCEDGHFCGHNMDAPFTENMMCIPFSMAGDSCGGFRVKEARCGPRLNCVYSHNGKCGPSLSTTLGTPTRIGMPPSHV